MNEGPVGERREVAGVWIRGDLADASPAGRRYEMLERAFALDLLDETGRRVVASRSHAEWVASLTDRPYTECCSTDVGQRAVRLEREADNWRGAVRFIAADRDGDLAARSCGPPVAFDLFGRHDLADIIRPLLASCAARLLTRLDPGVAARGLSAQLETTPVCPSFVDLIPRFYVAELVHRASHVAFRTTATASASAAPYPSRMDVVDLARLAFSEVDARSLDEVESPVRGALGELAA